MARTCIYYNIRIDICQEVYVKIFTKIENVLNHMIYLSGLMILFNNKIDPLACNRGSCHFTEKNVNQ
jgi:hypothetical protein